MNLLGLVFSILFILSYGYYSIWEKHLTGARVRSAYVSHQKAAREITNQFQSAFYEDLVTIQTEKHPSSKSSSGEPKGETEGTETFPKFNAACAQLNLFPLVQDGKQQHPQLYELMAKLLRTFYPSLLMKEKRFEYRFLDLLLWSLREDESHSLEKVAFFDLGMQKVYYKMLKGTKSWDLKSGEGYPPLLEYVKVEPADAKICLFHANPDMLSVVFDSKMAWKLCMEIHKKGGPLLTKELIQRLAFEAHVIGISEEFFELLQWTNYLGHKDKRAVFLAQQGEVFLRKRLVVSRTASN